MNLPNFLTLLRLVISPIFVFCFFAGTEIGIPLQMIPYLLLGLMIASELSDAFDGYLARRYNQVTDFGKVVDPMADSIAHISIFLCFTQKPVDVPVWMIFLFFYRDSAISTLRTICALRGYVLAARTSGKVKSVIQAGAAFIVVLLMIPHSQGILTSEELTYISSWIVGIAALYSVFSVVDYVYANRNFIGRSLIIRRKGKLNFRT